MKPDSRPISLTMPMPLKTLAASILGAADGVGGLVHRRFEAEGMGDGIDVVVNGFRNPDNGDVLAAPGDFLLDRRRSLHRPVAADDERRTDIQALKGGGDFG